MKLRSYQENIINQLRHDWKKHKTHLIQAPTGAGKSIIASVIMQGLHKNGLRALFTVPRTALVNQTVKHFHNFGIPCGVQQADHELTDEDKNIQVGTVQTLARRGYTDYDVIIVDEAHLRSVPLIEYIDNSSVKVIGLTATPLAPWMGNVYENFIKQVTTKDLMDQGYLSNYEFFVPTKPDVSKVKTVSSKTYGSDYKEDQIAEIMGDAKIAGDIVTTWLKYGKGLPTIAFCCNVLHANFLTVEMRKAGINAEVMTGSTPKEERQRIFKAFDDGIVKIICSVDVLVEGFDADVRCVIYAKPTKSEMRWIQSIGRALRLSHGKDKAIILDHSGTYFRLGMPHEIEYDELFSDGDKYKEAQQARKEDKPEKTEKECPSCHYIKPAGQYACEKCGFKPIYGENGEVDESVELQALNAKEEEDKKRWYRELCGYWQMKVNEGKNWKKGWISHKYKEKFGEWPDHRFSPIDPSAEVVNYIKHLNIKSAKSKVKYSIDNRGKNSRDAVNKLAEAAQRG